MTVNRLIGICSPIAPPKTLKKNKNKMPIPNLTVACPIKRIGLAGAPTIKRITIKAIMIEITSAELKSHQPLFLVPFLVHMMKSPEKEPKKQACGCI